MKKKVGVMMDSELYKKVKVYCAKKDISISELFAYAVELYMQRLEIIDGEVERQVYEDEVEKQYYEKILKNNGYVELREYKKE